VKIFFGQIYIEAGVDFPFSHVCQALLSKQFTALVVPSTTFVKTYGSDFELMFNVSAKTFIQDNEIRGPTVFRKAKDVEYTIFLPFDVISKSTDVPRTALLFLFRGACSVLESLGIETAKIMEKQGSLIERICADPKMFV
jgi:hypothetical protein